MSAGLRPSTPSVMADALASIVPRPYGMPFNQIGIATDLNSQGLVSLFDFSNRDAMTLTAGRCSAVADCSGAGLIMASSDAALANAPLFALSGDDGLPCLQYDRVTQQLAMASLHTTAMNTGVTLVVRLAGPLDVSGTGTQYEIASHGAVLGAAGADYGMGTFGRLIYGASISNGTVNQIPSGTGTGPPHVGTVAWTDRLLVFTAEIVGSNLVTKFYLDGTLVNSQSVAGATTITNVNATVKLGTNVSTAALNRYRMLAIFDRALPEGAVNQLAYLLLPRQDTHILFEGNSLTDGYYTSGAWVQEACGMLGRPVSHSNLAVTAKLLTNALANVARVTGRIRATDRKRIAVLFAHDLGTARATWLANVYAWAAAVKAADPKIRTVYLGGTPVAAFADPYEADRLAVNAAIKAAPGSFDVVGNPEDLAPVIGLTGASTNTTYYQSDHTHWTTAGARMFAELCAAPTIARVL